MALNVTNGKGLYGFSDWDNAFLTQQERDSITRQRQRAEAGEISWREANEFAEGLRGKYGYAGGSAGEDYIIKPVKIPNAYNSKLQGEISAQEKKVQGSTFEKFAEGSEYAALLDKYTEAGRRAMDDTVGTVAARTGGLASSFAQAAGQQAFNKYMEGLDESARALFEQEYQREKERLQMLREQEEQDYARHLDDVALRQGERDYRLQVGQQILDKQQYDDERERAARQQKWENDRTERLDGIAAEQQELVAQEERQTSAQEQVAYLLQNGIYSLEELVEQDPKLVEEAIRGGWSATYMKNMGPVNTDALVASLRQRGYSDLDIDGFLASLGL